MRHARVFRPDHAREAVCLALFLVSAVAFTVLLEHPDSPVRMSLVDPFRRRALMGLAMGLTAAALTCSPLGVRPGAHRNPTVTLPWARGGRIRPDHAAGHVATQVANFTALWIYFAAPTMGALLAAELHYRRARH